MGGLTDAVFRAVFGWLRSLCSDLWSAVAGYGGGALSWISGHWLLLAAVILIGGTVIDLAVYLFRWRPDIVWRSYFRRLRGEGVEAVPYGETPEPERVSRKWLYADGTTEDVPDWVEDEPADEWLEPEDLSQLRYEDDSLPEEDGYTSPDGYPEPADDEAPAGGAEGSARRRGLRSRISALRENLSMDEEDMELKPKYRRIAPAVDPQEAYQQPVYPPGWSGTGETREGNSDGV